LTSNRGKKRQDGFGAEGLPEKLACVRLPVMMALMARLIELFGVLDAQKALELGKIAFAWGTSEAKTTAHELIGS
jgi:hypothetical protein